MENNQRDFKGVWIPKEIWLDEKLNMLEKGILTEIDSLDNEKTGCYASNKYIADFCQCSETKVSSAVSKLKKLGYIYEKSFDGRQRILKSRLTNFVRQDCKKCDAGSQNLQHNNIYNNLDNNKNNKGFSGLVEQNFESEKVQNVLKIWLDHKKQKRQSYTEIGFKKLISKIKKDIDAHGEQYVLDAIDYSLEQNYAGIYPKPTTVKAQPKKEYIRHNYSAEVLQEQETSIEEF